MGASCCNEHPGSPGSSGSNSASGPGGSRFRKALWVALWVNAIMFGVEIQGSILSGSVSLLADAVDFLGDAANYGVSLMVLSMGLIWRARAALAKGITMGIYGVAVLGKAGWITLNGTTPEPLTMGMVGLLALIANLIVALMLYSFRNGDSNMRSVWLCTRNDVIGNLAVIAAAVGVFGSGQAWPDLIVAVIMAVLAISAAVSVIRHARTDMKTARQTSAFKPAL
jgi:Co/Zn/Cd efflux system component